MKIKNYSLKILSLAITLMMVLSIASIPAIAVETLPEGAYANVTNENSVSTYTLDQFKADFAAATYTAVETFENETQSNGSTSTGKANIYPFYAELTGVENGTFRLMLSDVDAKARLYLYSDATNAIPSGSSAIQRQYKSSDTNDSLKFVYNTLGNSVNYNVISNEENVALADIKITTVALAIRPGGAEQLSFTITYDDASTDKVGTSVLTANTNYFWGFKAEKGKYISEVQINNMTAHTVIDDLSLIFEKVVIPTDVVIADTEATVAEPQYNASKTIQLSATAYDENETVIENAAIKWSVTEKDGVSIDENGLLTLNRTEGTSIAGPITVTATSVLDSTKLDTVTIDVTPTEAYFASSAMGDYNATAYTRADFLADLNEAEHKTIINFEDGVNPLNTRRTVATIDSVVSNSGDTFKVIINSWETQDHTGSKQTKFNYNTGNMTLSNTENGEFEFVLPTGNIAGNCKATTFGMMLGKTGQFSLSAKLRIQLSDNTEEVIEYEDLGTQEDVGENCGFFGYKAPGGKYISNIEMEIGAQAILDDLCFIFEDPSTAPIKFSTDEAGENLIGGITGLADKIYINVKSGTLKTGEKAILALYDGTELIDVAMVDENATQAMATILSGKTLTTVKAFVWDFANGLVPVQNAIEIDK